MRITVCQQCPEQLRDVLGAAGFHGDVDGRVAQIYSVISAVIRGLDYVGPLIGEDAGRADERGDGPGVHLSPGRAR